MGSTRRKHLGLKISAALPALWKALARLDWSHADFASAAGISSAGATQILYGDVKAGRRVSTFCADELGVKAPLWDKACPPNWRPNQYEPLRRAKRDRDAEYGATGTDGE